jgi:hypothetical protein
LTWDTLYIAFIRIGLNQLENAKGTEVPNLKNIPGVRRICHHHVMLGKNVLDVIAHMGLAMIYEQHTQSQNK